MTEVLVPWLSEIRAAIDALADPDEWKTARHAALKRLSERFESEFGAAALRLPPAVLVQMQRSARQDAEALAAPRWLPKRPGRRMPSVLAIAKHWAGRHPFEDVHLDEPQCFGCRWSATAWSSANFERAHLVDRFLGGLDHAGNLVPLCRPCHRVMPMFEIDQGQDAIDWVGAGGWVGEVADLVGHDDTLVLRNSRNLGY